MAYGCNLGPSQTARSVQGTDRRQIAWINAHRLSAALHLRPATLRSTIQGATNKSGALNRFLKWTFFGGDGIITENSRDEQRKAIKS